MNEKYPKIFLLAAALLLFDNAYASSQGELAPPTPVKSVRFNTELDVLIFENPIVKPQDATNKTEFVYVRSLKDEPSITIPWSLGMRLLHKSVLPKNSRPKKYFDSGKLKDYTELMKILAIDTLEKGVGIAVPGKFPFKKEKVAADCYAHAARWHLVEQGVLLLEAENNSDRDEDGRLAERLGSARAKYVESLSLAAVLYYSVLHGTKSLYEFHTSAHRFFKVLRAMGNEGRWHHALQYVRAFAEIANGRMFELHQDDDMEELKSQLCTQKLKLELQILMNQKELDKAKAMKGKKANRSRKILHYSNIVAYDQERLKDFNRFLRRSFDLGTLEQPLYLCEQKNGCPDCLNFLRDINEWEQLVLDHPVLFQHIGADSPDHGHEGSE